MAELLGLRLKEHELSQTPHRVGLLHRRTGIPVFVLYVHQSKAREFFVRSLNELEDLISTTSHKEDRLALSLLRPYFFCGGHECVVSVSPRTEGDLTRVVGSNSTYRDRTGLQRLWGILDRADLVVIPQLPWLLDLSEYSQLIPEIQRVLGDSAAVALVDFPAQAEKTAIEQLVRSFDEPAIAGVYPLAFSEGRPVPATVAWSGLISRSDAADRLSERFLNSSIDERVVPLRVLAPRETESLLARHVNVLHYFGHHGTRKDSRFVGGLTFSQDREPGRASLLAQRTIRALQDAILSTCEEFVMEPAQDSVEERLRATLTHLLESNEDFFEKRGERSFDLDLRLEEKNGQTGFQVQCRFFLPEAVREIQLELNI